MLKLYFSQTSKILLLPSQVSGFSWQLVRKNYQKKCFELYEFIEAISIIYVEKCFTMVYPMKNLIGFKMTYDKPYLVAILNLDEFFIRWPQILYFCSISSVRVRAKKTS